MTLKECYAAMEGNFDDVISRLRNEKIVRKLVIKFLNDDTYSLLCGALEAQHPDEAFRAAHTLKGICQNLSFTKLYLSSSRLTEALRSGWTPDAVDLARQIEADYRQTISAIEQLQAEDVECIP